MIIVVDKKEQVANIENYLNTFIFIFILLIKKRAQLLKQ